MAITIPSLGVRLTRAGGSVFSPLSLFAAGEQGAWLDPSDFSSMFQDSAGTTPVTATGQPVGKINDKSGRGNHATQATAAARPVLQQDAGGKYYLNFDGVDDVLATAAINFTATDKATLFVGSYQAIAANKGITGFGDITSQNGTFDFSYFSNSSPLMYYRANSPFGAGSGNTALLNNQVLTAQIDLAGNSYLTELPTLRANGVALTRLTYGASDSGTGNFGTYPLSVGNSIAGGGYLLGRIYGLIVRGAASSAGEITSAETYVNGKTGAF